MAVNYFHRVNPNWEVASEVSYTRPALGRTASGPSAVAISQPVLVSLGTRYDVDGKSAIKVESLRRTGTD